MRIYLRDYTWNANQGSEWAKQFGICFDLQNCSYAPKDSWQQASVCQESFESDSFKAANVVVFVHASNDTARKAWANAAASWLAGHIVFVSRPGQLTPGTVGEALIDLSLEKRRLVEHRIHACWWKASDFGGREMKTEVRELIDAIKSDRDGWWKWTQPTETSVLVAVAILCQGYLAARGRYDLLFPKEQQPQQIRPVPVQAAQAVMRLTWWQQPFVGINLEQEIAKECFGATPDEIGNLLATLAGADDFKDDGDYIVGDALRRIQTLLNE